MAKTIRIAPPGESPSGAAVEKAEALIGKVVSDRYRVDQVITCGEGGAVYRATFAGMRLRVILKVLHAGAPPEAMARFEKEAVAAAHVRHPNVARATDAGSIEDGTRFIAFEHVIGPTLRDVLDKGKLSVARAVHVARQIASALSAAHGAGVVHRAVEPRNVLLAGPQGDEAVLVDFGRAKVDLGRFPEGGEVSAAPDSVVIAGPYSAPEASAKSGALDERSDLYSLGVVLFEMLAGRRPDGSEPLPADLAVPAPICAVTSRLLKRDPAERFPTALALLDALEAIPAAPSIRARARGAVAGVADRVVPMARRAIGGYARVPGWALISLSACVPLAFIVSWLIFRGGARPESVTGESAAPPAEVAPADSAPAAASSAPVVVSPSGTVSASAPEVDGIDAATARARLREVGKTKDWNKAAKAIQSLATLEPDALHDPAVVASIVSVAVALETTGGAQSDAIFDLLSQRSGTDGLDILFEIVRTRGGTKGSKRSGELLRSPEIAERETPGLRAAFALRDASCDKKPSLYDKVVAEGDERSVTELRVMRESQCERRRKKDDPCCFDHDPLDKAIEQLRDRLKK